MRRRKQIITKIAAMSLVVAMLSAELPENSYLSKATAADGDNFNEFAFDYKKLPDATL